MNKIISKVFVNWGPGAGKTLDIFEGDTWHLNENGDLANHLSWVGMD